MATINPSTLTLLIVIPLILWRMYSRIRRMVGKQRLSRVRPWITIVIFPLILAMLALGSFRHPENLAILAAGVTAGALLGLYGLKRTQFEPTPEGLFYTPNAHLGIALSLLFIGRIVYRFIEIFAMGVPNSGQDFARSPLTLSIFGLLAGYYVCYAIGLVRWRWGVLERKRQRESAQAASQGTPSENTPPE